MGKRRSGGKQSSKKGHGKVAATPTTSKINQKYYKNIEEVSEDEVDQFHSSRDKVLLDAEIDDRVHGNGDDSDYGEGEEVFGMDLSDEDDYEDDQDDEEFEEDEEEFEEDDEDEDEEFDEDEEDVKEYIKKMPGLRRRISAFEQEEMESSDGNDDEDAKVEEEDLAWGNRKQAYYNDDAEMDEDAAREEEDEALRLRQKRVQSMADEDFLDDFSGAIHRSAVSLLPDEDQDRRLVREFDDELDKLDAQATDPAAASVPIEKDLEGMSRQEVLQHLSNESPEFVGLVSDFQAKITELKSSIGPLLQRLREGQLPTAQGVSLLELKNQLVLTYCLNMAYYFYLKADGRRVSDHPVIEKLVQLRLYLEKLKPIEQKLRYQIDKLVKAAVTAPSVDDPSAAVTAIENGEEQRDALQFRANPDNLLAGDDDAATAQSTAEKEDGIYKAPKIAPVHFDETIGMSAAEKNRRQLERLRKQATSSRMMQDLMAEVGEVPEEIVDAGNMLAHNAQKDEEWEERIRAEEEMMTRLPVSRKDKHKIRQQKRFANELENLDDFGDYEFIERLNQFEETGGDDERNGGGAIKKNSAKQLRELINRRLPESDAANRKRKQGGDDDVPRREKRMAQQLSTAGEDYNTHLNDNNSDDAVEEEDEFYQQVQDAKRTRKQQRAAMFEEHQRDLVARHYASEEEVDGKRVASYDILKNKGLTPHRKKEQRNPRVKRRVQYEKKMIKLKSFKPAMRTQEKRYEGESTGIKKNLARSVRF